MQRLLVKPRTCDTLWLLRRLVVGGSSSMTASFLKLPESDVPRAESCLTRRFLRRKLILGIFLYWGTPPSVWDLVISSTSYDFLILPLLVQSEVKKAFGRFQLEAPRAYKCKQILGLCYSPPRMENRFGLWKKNLCEVKNVSSLHMSFMTNCHVSKA